MSTGLALSALAPLLSQCSVDDRVPQIEQAEPRPAGSAGVAGSSPEGSAGAPSESTQEGSTEGPETSPPPLLLSDGSGVQSPETPSPPPCQNVCSEGSSECTTSGVQSCQVQASGCTAWVATESCGPHQSCRVEGTAEASRASCSCNASACEQPGMLCQDAFTIATCAQDENGCLYVSGSSACTGGQACSGLPPGSACALTCSDSCTLGQAACLPGGLATCAVQTNGCAAYGTPVACGQHQSCTGSAGSARCSCDTDPVCRAAGSACADGATLATCSTDPDGCVYTAGTSPCEDGACSAGACCTNACTAAPSSCDSSASLQSCEVGVNGCTALVSRRCGTGLVCERVGTAACADPQWAEWPMPNIVMDTNAGAPNPENYSINADGTVTDTRTKLMWQTGSSPLPVTWGDASTAGTAQAYCSGLTLAGFSDWRLPTLIELFSLLDIGATDPGNGRIINLFPTPSDSFYWSSTPGAGEDGGAWAMYYSSFLDAYNNRESTSEEGLARCVR